MNLTEKQMKEALVALESHLDHPIRLIVGGGGSMIMAHHFPLSTADIDAVPTGIDLSQLDQLVKKVAKDLNLAPDWLNPYYSTFTHVLPTDYGNRLVKVLSLKNLEALALSKEDLLIMKCFARRQKDVAHVKALIQKGVQIPLVEKHLEFLKKKKIPGAEEALDFLDDVQDQM